MGTPMGHHDSPQRAGGEGVEVRVNWKNPAGRDASGEETVRAPVPMEGCGQVS